jgi:hypothetical protein
MVFRVRIGTLEIGDRVDRSRSEGGECHRRETSRVSAAGSRGVPRRYSSISCVIRV